MSSDDEVIWRQQVSMSNFITQNCAYESNRQRKSRIEKKTSTCFFQFLLTFLGITKISWHIYLPRINNSAEVLSGTHLLVLHSVAEIAGVTFAKKIPI